MYKNYKQNFKLNDKLWILIDDDFEEEWNGGWENFIRIYKDRELDVVKNVILFAMKEPEPCSDTLKRFISNAPEYKDDIEKYLILL